MDYDNDYNDVEVSLSENEGEQEFYDNENGYESNLDTGWEHNQQYFSEEELMVDYQHSSDHENVFTCDQNAQWDGDPEPLNEPLEEEFDHRSADDDYDDINGLLINLFLDKGGRRGDLIRPVYVFTDHVLI